MRGQNPNNIFYDFFSAHLHYAQTLIYKAVRGKCENTEKYQTYPSGRLGSTKFTVGLDDQPKRFCNSIMVF